MLLVQYAVEWPLYNILLYQSEKKLPIRAPKRWLAAISSVEIDLGDLARPDMDQADTLLLRRIFWGRDQKPDIL